MSKISIIIPNYNNGQYLDSCLKSVISQTHADIEVICIDDKSTDNSLEILNNYAKKDKRIQIIALAENRGVSNARNIGLEHITGDYVCFLDSDDYLEITACENLLASIKTYHSDLALGGHIKLNSLGQKISKWLPKKKISINPKADIYDFTKHRNTTQKLFKADIIKKNNIYFNTDLNYMEDAVFLMNYLNYCKKISSTKNVVYVVRINPNSLCRNSNLKTRRKNDSKKASEIIKKF